MLDFGECVTHHHACDCRERQWNRMWDGLEAIIQRSTYGSNESVENLESKLRDIRERAKQVLKWKG